MIDIPNLSVKRPLGADKISARRIATRKLQSVSQAGCYSLVIELKQRKKIQVGKLGKGEFQPGLYIYTGSAMGGLRARLLRRSERVRRRCDGISIIFLTPSRRALSKIFLYPAAPGQECRQNRKDRIDLVAHCVRCASLAPRIVIHAAAAILFFFPRGAMGV